MAHVLPRAMPIRSTTCRRRRPSSGSSPSSCSRCSTSSGSGGNTGPAGAAARSTRTARVARPHAGSCTCRSAGRPESRGYPGLPRPHRLAVQVAALSRPSHGFESRWGHIASHGQADLAEPCGVRRVTRAGSAHPVRTPMRTSGPCRIARPVALSRAARKSRLVKLMRCLDRLDVQRFRAPTECSPRPARPGRSCSRARSTARRLPG